MKTIKYLIIFTLSLFVMNSCEDGPSTDDINYVSFEGSSFSFPVEIDGTSEYPISIFSTQITGSDRTFSIKVNTDLSTADPASYTVPSTVTIPANKNEGIIPVIISDINIGIAGKKLILEFESQEDLFTGDDIQLNITQSCPGDEVFLDILFDGYGSETTWKLEDSDNNLVASGGPYEDGDTSYSTSFCLGVGSYKFTAYDAYGDGLSYPNLGSFTLTKNSVELVEIVGDFGAEASQNFIVQ